LPTRAIPERGKKWTSHMKAKTMRLT
jgi:hypothetical protein